MSDGNCTYCHAEPMTKHHHKCIIICSTHELRDRYTELEKELDIMDKTLAERSEERDHALESLKMALDLMHCDSTCVAWSSIYCQCGNLDEKAKLKSRHPELAE